LTSKLTYDIFHGSLQLLMSVIKFHVLLINCNLHCICHLLEIW
jgi:hypothetical protein